jgi:hypothetical protein
MRPSIVAIVAVWLGSASTALAVPPNETRNPPEERVTAPPPVGGRPSGGEPPPPRLRAAPEWSDTSSPANLGLQREADGSYSYVDPGRMFTAQVMPDGRVRFADRWRRPDAANAQHGKCCGRPPEGVLVAINPFGGVGMRGPLEWIMQATGHDLAASAKMQMLKETRGFRTQLAVAWTRAQVEKRLHELPAELLAVWSDTQLDDARKREILFERWDECEDRLGLPTDGLPPDAIPEVDQMRRRAADDARAKIEAFIRKHAPESGERAFDAQELTRYNDRRRSVRRFAPYHDPQRLVDVDEEASD